MYEKYFDLRERPFELGSDLRFLYLPAPHREALSNLQYAISSRKGVTVLTGEAGTGKTTLVRAALAQANASSLCVHLTNPRLTRDEFIEFLVEGFKLDGRARESKVACMAALEERLIGRLNRGEHSTLVVDEAQTVSADVLEEIRLLTNLETADGTRPLSLILAGQPEFGDRLNAPELRHLKQRVALRCELRALTLHETAAFIATRIRVAGGVATAVFTREAVQVIHEASGGIPRVVCVLCDNALMTGFGIDERPVGSRVVRDVCRDFHVECREPAEEPRARSEAGEPAPPLVPATQSGAATPLVSDAAAETAPLFASVTAKRRFRIF